MTFTVQVPYFRACAFMFLSVSSVPPGRTLAATIVPFAGSAMLLKYAEMTAGKKKGFSTCSIDRGHTRLSYIRNHVVRLLAGIKTDDG